MKTEGSGGIKRQSASGLSPLVIAAHELKSPLALLRQLALTLESDGLTEAERVEITTHMRMVSERALRLTSDISKVARLEDALFVLEPLNPQQLCEDVLYELGPLYRACGRQLILAPRRHAPLVIANKDLLRRILLNFGDNALHYGDDQTPVELSVRPIDHGRAVRLGVRDVGPALPASVWDNLESTLNQPQQIHGRPESSGLGLAIARSFAESMNSMVGTVRHRDGATFFVDVHASTQLSLL